MLTNLSKLIASAVLALWAAACGDNFAAPGASGDDGPGDEEKHLYIAATWVADTESTNTYVALIDSLDVEEIELTKAIELPGYGDAWVHEGMIFVADGETPTVRKMVVENGKLKQEAAISFANFGVYGASFYDNEILTSTVAYLSDSGGKQYIVWNPTTMKITGTVPWPTLAFDAGLEPFHSYTDRGGVLVGNNYFHGIYGHNYDWDGFGGKSYVIVNDITDNSLVATIEVPCAMTDVASLGDDGYLYVSGWTYIPLSMIAGRSTTNCAARIDTRTRTIDTAWTTTFPAITGGDEGHALRVVEANRGVAAVFHGSGVPVTPDMDMWDLDVADDDWELYEMDLTTKQMTPTGVLFSDGSFYESHMDGKYYVYLGKGPYTQVYERGANGYTPKLRASGWLSRIFQLK